jgi:uncharacterized Ntn-hydrolase superfamily protein
MKLATFSIVARCARSGELGVAVSTKVPCVGSLCPYARSGVGAVATQAWVNPYLGPRVLDALARGLSAQDAMQAALDSDQDREIRQLGVVDALGNAPPSLAIAPTHGKVIAQARVTRSRAICWLARKL